MITLTASENYTSKAVRLAHGLPLGSFYEFTPPYNQEDGEWYFPQSGGVPRIIQRLQNSANTLFETQVFDWRPNGGSVAEDAVMMGVCKNKGDSIIHFSHSQGGHFAIEPLAARMGIKYYHLPVEQNTLLIDVPALHAILKNDPSIRLVMLDQSFKLRMQPLEAIKSILPTGVVLAYDCSHDGGLIAGGALQQPLASGADIVFGNTHKTIPGPNKAFVGWKDPNHWSIQPISESIVPTLQSNCHSECLVPMLLSFKELEFYGRDYASQVVRNAKVFARSLRNEGFKINGESFGFTETHQVHIVLGDPIYALDILRLLEDTGIRVNNIEIPGQRGTHGLRLGVQAMTRAHMVESDFEELAKIMSKIILQKESRSEMRSIVEDFSSQFNRNRLAFSFDEFHSEDFFNDFLKNIL